ncbi:MAG: portal protein, partial [Tepidimonas sp.]
MASAYCMPRHFGSWNTTGPASYFQNSAAQARRFAFDNTGVRALAKYAAILERLASPRSQRWHGLEASDHYLNKQRAVKSYFEAMTELLFKVRYQAKSKFTQSSAEVYASLGVYGTGPQYIGQRKRTALDKRGGP